MIRAAFTLIELVVVLAIVALLAGMVVISSPRQSRALTVQLAAEQVAATLRTARAMALADHDHYMVSFNISNARGSSGAVVNNRDGGHWWRIVRGRQLMIGTTYPYRVGYPQSVAAGGTGAAYGLSANNARETFESWSANGGWWNGRNRAGTTITNEGTRDPSFAHHVEAVRAKWVGERHTLPAGKVRFLALGDADEGPRLRWDPGSGAVVKTGTGSGYTYGPLYPRPWFGFYDEAAKRLHPWGAFEADLPEVDSYGSAGLPKATLYSGLFYQGIQDALPPEGCLNPDDRVYEVDWNGDKSISGSDPLRGPESAWYLLRKGEVRPLIDGEWADFCIVFDGQGRASFPAMKGTRRFYEWDNGRTGGSLAWVGGAGPSDLAKNWSWNYGADDGEDGNGDKYTVSNGESIHYQAHTGGAFITLAPDAPDDNTAFPTAEAALRSIMPMHRVFVSQAGVVEVVKVRWNDGVLTEAAALGGTPWPDTTARFEDATYLDDNYRYGWLHENGVQASHRGPHALVPRGRPITDQVSPEMMTRRIWWIDGIPP